MDRKQELREKMMELQKEIWAIEDREAAEENKEYLNKCFRYQNSYSGGESWWLYQAVIGQEDSLLKVFEFEIDSNGEASTRIDTHPASCLGPSYPKNLFKKEWAKFKKYCDELAEKAIGEMRWQRIEGE